MSVVHVVSVSGGKDSTATALIARATHKNVRYVFADTGNELPPTYQYLDYLRSIFGKIDVVRADFSDRIRAKRMFIARDRRTGRKDGRKVRWTNKAKRRALAVLHPSGNPYLDLCLWKGRFPSRMAQFCTAELKVALLMNYQESLREQYDEVVSWQGIRRDESQNRRNALAIEELGDGHWIYRPIIDWTAQQTVDFVRDQGVKLNPLYSQGMSRVGCFCINSKKEEIREVSVRFPSEVDRISDWEWRVGQASKRGAATFMCDANDAKDIREVFAALNIRSRVAWSETARGGKQIDFYMSDVCSSSYGLCE